MSPGRLVVLNGPSSAGKTTLANAVAALLPTPWLVMPVDLFHAIRTRPDVELSREQWASVFRRTRAAHHRALAGAARAGCDVIGDVVLHEPWRLADLLEVTQGVDALLVHVTCDADELDRREAARGDRNRGTARDQMTRVFAHHDCDLSVDTTAANDPAALAVVRLLEQPPADRAFDRLRRAAGVSGA
jgi:chloramphenicol 3-O phosphotransferase